MAAKNERILLALCSTKVSRGEAPFDITHQELVGELKRKGIEADRQFVHETLFKLQNRTLLRWCSSTAGNSVQITLSQQGYDLGRKYTSLRGKIAVWCAEYMWLFVVLGAIIGAVTLVVTIFKN